ncbi:hypothetical protein BJN42_19465 [Pseudomonas koreensis]|nr:hypothetical protein BJN42_19465 [Pseudomonas koreensis]
MGQSLLEGEDAEGLQRSCQARSGGVCIDDTAKSGAKTVHPNTPKPNVGAAEGSDRDRTI